MTSRVQFTFIKKSEPSNQALQDYYYRQVCLITVVELRERKEIALLAY